MIAALTPAVDNCSIKMTMLKYIRNLSICCSICIAAFGIYGCIIDEAYFRDVGHTPTTFDVLNWLLIVLNLPSYVLVRSIILYVSPGYITDHLFMMQYLFWPILSVLQWWGYVPLARLISKYRHVQFTLPIVAIMTVIASIISTVSLWTKIKDEIHEQWGLLEVPISIIGIGATAIILWIMATQVSKARLHATS